MSGPPTMAQSPRCKSCGEQILWVLLVSANNPGGKPHPLDSVPSLVGTIERKRGLVTSDYYGRIVPREERTKPLYVSHFATCKHASKWRKKDNS